MEEENCSFFSHLNPCHLKHHIRTIGTRNVSNWEEKNLLKSRSGVQNIETICHHHEQCLLRKFTVLQKKCCDPFSHHKKPRAKSLKVINDELFQSARLHDNVNIVPGTKVCLECYLKLKSATGPTATVTDEIESSDCDDASASNSPQKENAVHDVNVALSYLDGTPVKCRNLPSSSKKVVASKKLKSATETLKRKLEDSYDVKLEDAVNVNVSKDKLDLKLYQSLLNELKAKFHASQSYQERVCILTLSPFTIEQTMEEFKATNHMVKKARNLKKSDGILGQSAPRKGKPVSEDLKKQIINFFENDENSRVLPGIKDSVSVRNGDGIKVHMQRRLILSNLKELYALWKTEKEKVVGFSTFASLRPKWCILAGSSGTHAVCVCKHHQNPKLMVEAIFSNYAVHDLMSLCVCSTDEETCMMGTCNNCPGKDKLLHFLHSCEELTDIDQVTYKQWISTDRTELKTVVEDKEEFFENLVAKVNNLTRHSFTAKSQSSYMKYLKANMTSETDIILQGDFSENFAFTVQDEIQSYHWENKQATLHPFVAYHRDIHGKLEHRNICVISDSTEHSTTAVFAFLKVVIPFLKSQFHGVKKIHYFTDGCAAQYKNKHNFINLCHHEDDFNLSAEWNFFATSHGKSACDGIGGTLKRLVTKASLQRPYNNQILTVEDIIKFAEESIPGITLFNIPPSSILQAESYLKPRFECSVTIKGTLGYHRFVPISATELFAFRTSFQASPVKVSVSNVVKYIEPPALNIQMNNFVCCIYESLLWIALVVDKSDEFGDFKMKFLHPHFPSRQFHFPSPADMCWVELTNIICRIDSPSLTSSSLRSFRLSDEDFTKLEEHHVHKKFQS